MVLAGAELAAVLPAWRIGASGHREDSPTGATTMIAALQILERLLSTSQQGRGLCAADLQASSPLMPGTLATLLEVLRRNRYVAINESGEWFLARDLEATTLAPLHRDLDLSLLPSDMSDLHAADWGRRYAELAATADQAHVKPLSVPLKDFLAPSGGGEIIEIARAGGDEDNAESAP